MSPPVGPLFRLGSFSSAGEAPFAGLVLGERVHAIQGLRRLERRMGLHLHGVDSVLGLLERWDDNLPALRSIAQALSTEVQALPTDSERLPADRSLAGTPLLQLRTHAPLVPRQIFQAGANYHKHVVDLIVDGAAARDPSIDREQVRANAAQMMRARAESGKPFVFMGLASSLTGPYDPIVVPHDVRQPDWELELAAVIGRPARRVKRTEALDYVAGYTIANDITARERVARPDVPQMGMDWVASKGAPTFLPIGPYLTPSEFVADPQRLQITLKLNGQVMQAESTADMIFTVARIIEFISEQVQLLPGDLVLTGSPSGNGTHYGRFIRDGDVLEGEVTGLGVLRNPCLSERKPSA
jgi:2-keto-4-pentenoate hydratase/2-oxohepta-3-ene-1,7-dioic acid hydratase in catechol pathway